MSARGFACGSLAERLCAQYHRASLAASLVVALVLVVFTEWVRPGHGRRIGRHCIRRVGVACGISFATRGAGRFDATDSGIFVANHSSVLDIPAMLMACHEAQFLAAAGLFRIPLLAQAMRALGTEAVDRHDTAKAYGQLSSLASRGLPRFLTIFAEGRLAPPGQRLPFKTDAFTLAIETGTPVVPVAIHGADHVLPAGARLAHRPGVVTVEFLEPIPTNGLTQNDRDWLRDRVRQAIVTSLRADGVPNSADSTQSGG